MVNLHGVGQFDDTITALWRARADVRDAMRRADELPRAFGRGEAVAELGSGLDASAARLQEFAHTAAPIDTSLGTTFTELAERLRTAAPLADSRSGVAALRRELVDLDRSLSTSLDLARTTRTAHRFPTPEAADDRLREFATDGPDAMTRQRWLELADIATLTGERRASLMSDRFDSLADWAARLVDHGHDPAENSRLVARFNTWRAPIAFPDRAAATERLASLASVPAPNLSRADLYDLHAISTLDEGIRPESLNAFQLDDALEAARTGDGLKARSVTAARLRGIESTKVWPSREHAMRDALELIGAGPSEMTAERMAVLAAISELPSPHNPGIVKYAPLHDLATDLQTAGSLTKLEAMTAGRTSRVGDALLTTNEGQGIVRRWLNQMRGPVAWPTRDTATSRLQDIAFAWRERGTLSPSELDDLDALARLVGDLRPRHLEPLATGFEPPRYADASSFMVATFDERTIDDWVRGTDA